jgi:heptosyltransferase-2
VIVAPNWLGDAVMALPLVADVRRRWPERRLAVAGRGSVAAMFRMVDGVDDVVALEGGGGFGAIAAVQRNVETLRAGGFDTALLLPNSFLSAWTVARAGIAERWGYRADARGRLLTRSIRKPAAYAHQADYYQALGAALGVPSGPRLARITVSDAIGGRARAFLAEAGVADDAAFVAMAPGAAYGRAKQWLPERFAELAVLLERERGMTTVLVGSSGDSAVCRHIRKASRAADLSGRTDLEALAGVLALARAAVSNDSGAMHLAAAAGTRVVGVFGATNEKRTAPLPASEGDAPAIVATNVWCRPCMLRECPIDHRCMTGISARAVFNTLVEGPGFSPGIARAES